MRNKYMKSLPLFVIAGGLLVANVSGAQTTTTTTTTTTDPSGATTSTVEKTTTNQGTNTANQGTVPASQPVTTRRRIVSPVGVTGTIRRSHRRQDRRN